MKNRNVILSLVVMVASVGTALATSFLVATPTWVHGFKVVAPNTFIETCSTLGDKCDVISPGNRNCEIIVNRNGTPTSTIGYSDNTCVTPLRVATDAPPVDDGKLTIYNSVTPYVPN